MHGAQHDADAVGVDRRHDEQLHHVGRNLHQVEQKRDAHHRRHETAQEGAGLEECLVRQVQVAAQVPGGKRDEHQDDERSEVGEGIRQRQQDGRAMIHFLVFQLVTAE